MSKDDFKKNIEESVDETKKQPTNDSPASKSPEQHEAVTPEKEASPEEPVVELIRKETTLNENPEPEDVEEQAKSPETEVLEPKDLSREQSAPATDKPKEALTINEKFAQKEPVAEAEESIDIFAPQSPEENTSDDIFEAPPAPPKANIPASDPTPPKKEDIVIPAQNKWEPLKPEHRTYVRLMWMATIGGIIGLILLFVGLSFGDLPSTEALENPQSELASQVFAADGSVLGRYFVENRVPVHYNDLSPHLRNALVATEDERYFEHCGIDFTALGRAIVKTGILRQRSAGGASTITQQLSKLLFTEHRASGIERVIQKLKEWIIAVRLERKYTKQEIMAMYLNKFDFLYDSHGIKAAAETYFGKSQDSLKIEEAAMLVGMLKNPSLFNPRRRPDTVLHRRMVVLKQMLRNNLLTQEAYDSLRQLPLDISNFKRSAHTEGMAQYFRMELGKRVKDILRSDQAKKKPGGEPYDIYRDGLKIYTTIDPVYQAHAEAAMIEHMSALQKKFDRYWKSRQKDPWTYRGKDVTEGEIRARERKLKHLIQNSDRYRQMRDRFLTEEILSALTEEVDGLQLRDIDIERMLEAEKDKKALRKLVQQNLITEKMATQYRKALKTKAWKAVKTKWLALQKAVDEAFDKPVKMRVFAYNDAMEKDTVMSPLDSIKYHHHFLQIGSIAIDPHTGYVKAWIGGINQKYFAFDHTSTNRQVGSTFKPFVYAAAIQQLGVSPCERVADLPRTVFPGENNFSLLEPWTPQNSHGEYTGERMTLKEALRKSVNSVSVELMKRLGGTQEVRKLAQKMGIAVDEKYPNGQLRVPDAPSICLGSCDLTVMEMAGAYTAFANNGTFIRPVYIRKIEDKFGRVIYSAELEESDALEPVSNYVMVEMLKYAAGGMGLKTEVGGKTGTTNDYVDGWFVGITPNLVVGTWVGGEDRWIRFLDISNGQGARMAKPFFKKFIERLEKDTTSGFDTNAHFSRPNVPINIQLDCDAYDHPGNTDDEFEDDINVDPFMEDPFGDEAPLKRDSTIQFR